MGRTIFISGANRGIGLGLAQSYLAKGDTVFVGARNPDASRDLWELERDYGARVRIVSLDVTSDADATAVAKLLAGQPLDLLINNAGVLPKSRAFADIPLEDMRQSFEVNVLGPMRLTQKLLPNLRAARQPTVATLTSKMGSIADNTSGGSVAYRVSKTAVNMLMTCFRHEFPEMTTVLLHPGWVQTEMGGSSAPTTVAESIKGLVEVIDGLKPKDSGRFVDFRGKDVAW